MRVRLPPFAPAFARLHRQGELRPGRLRDIEACHATAAKPRRRTSSGSSEGCRAEAANAAKADDTHHMKTEFADVTETRKTVRVEIPTDLVNAEIDRIARDYSRKAR